MSFNENSQAINLLFTTGKDFQNLLNATANKSIDLKLQLDICIGQ